MANPHPIKPLELVEESHFHRKDALKSGTQGAMLGGGAGLFGAAIQNSLAKGNVGAFGVFTKFGSIIATTAAAGSVYMFSRDATANLRQKDDYLNTTVASFLAGATTALRSSRIPRILGAGAAFSVIMTAFEYTGGELKGKKELTGLDEYERKEALRLNRRRPMSETISFIGEGRGIEPEGYEERRRERLKEKYGVEINPVSARAD